MFGTGDALVVGPEVLPRVGQIVLEFVWEAVEPVELPPFVESTLRGGMGRALRERACLTGAEDCEGCALLSECTYGRLWETRPRADDELPARFRTPPPPYMIARLSGGEGGRMNPGDRMRVQVKLMGAARSLVSDWVLAARDAGRSGFGRGRGVLELSEVTAMSRLGAPKVLYLVPHGFLNPQRLPQWWVEPRVTTETGPARVRLRFESPTELKGLRRNHFDPGVLTGRLLERLELLSIHHEHRRPRWDIQRRRADTEQCQVLATALEPVRWQRVSSAQGRRVPMQGLRGHVEIANVSPELVALWSTAQDIHVGKKTAFGLGRIKLERLA